MKSQFYLWGQDAAASYTPANTTNMKNETHTRLNSDREYDYTSTGNTLVPLPAVDELSLMEKTIGTLRGQVKMLKLSRKNLQIEKEGLLTEIESLKYQLNNNSEKAKAELFRTVAVQDSLHLKIHNMEKEISSYEMLWKKLKPSFYGEHFQINAINSNPLKRLKVCSVVYTRPSRINKIYFYVVGSPVEINDREYIPCRPCRELAHFGDLPVMIETELLHKPTFLQRLLVRCKKKHSY